MEGGYKGIVDQITEILISDILQEPANLIKKLSDKVLRYYNEGYAQGHREGWSAGYQKATENRKSDKTYWAALYKFPHEEGQGMSRRVVSVEYRLGSQLFDSEEACRLVARRQNFVKAVPIFFNTVTGYLYQEENNNESKI